MARTDWRTRMLLGLGLSLVCSVGSMGGAQAGEPEAKSLTAGMTQTRLSFSSSDGYTVRRNGEVVYLTVVDGMPVRVVFRSEAERAKALSAGDIHLDLATLKGAVTMDPKRQEPQPIEGSLREAAQQARASICESAVVRTYLVLDETNPKGGIPVVLDFSPPGLKEPSDPDSPPALPSINSTVGCDDFALGGCGDHCVYTHIPGDGTRGYTFEGHCEVLSLDWALDSCYCHEIDTFDDEGHA